MLHKTTHTVLIERTGLLALLSTALFWLALEQYAALAVALIALGLSMIAIRKAPALVSLWLSLSLSIHVVIGMAAGGYKWPYFDDVLHFFLVGTLTLIAIREVHAKTRWSGQRLSPLQLVFIGILFSLGIGASWEIFEYLIDLTGVYHSQHGLRDTIADIFFGGLGGLITSLLAPNGKLPPLIKTYPLRFLKRTYHSTQTVNSAIKRHGE